MRYERLIKYLWSTSLLIFCSSGCQFLIEPDFDSQVEGYTDKLSYNVGDKVRVFLTADSVYDEAFIGLYDLTGERFDIVQTSLAVQSLSNEAPWAIGLGYELSFEYILPELPSGVYLWAHSVPFIVKAPSQTTRIKVLYPSNTAAAYNIDGGKSLYDYHSSNNTAADSVSFQRRIPLERSAVECLRAFANTSGHEFGYLIDRDMDDNENLAGVELLIIAGHSEYWTRKARVNFDKFIDSGGHALILSGNTMWWQVRYSADGTRLVAYKSAGEDPIDDPLLATINWNEDQLAYPIIPSIGADFDRGGYGLDPDDKGWDGMKLIDISAPYLAGTGIQVGAVLSIPSREYDGTIIAGLDSLGYPYPDTAALAFEQIKIIGFDNGFRSSPTIGTWIEFKKALNSGIIINVATMGWCASSGIGGVDGEKIRQITFNMIDYLLGS